MLIPQDWMSQKFPSGARSQRIPKELLAFSLHWNSGEVVSNISKGMLHSIRIDELTDGNEGKKVKISSFFHVFLGGLPLESVTQI